MSTRPDPQGHTGGGILMGLYITVHDDTVMGDQAALCKSETVLKIEIRKTRAAGRKWHPVLIPGAVSPSQQEKTLSFYIHY